MHGTAVEWVVVIAGLLGLVGLANSGIQPSGVLLFAAAVIAVALAFWAVRTQPRPEEVYSPIEGGRKRVRSSYAPIWFVLPAALVAGWLFTVYVAGTILASVMAVEHTRSGIVMYSTKLEPSARSSRRPCTALSVVLATERGPVPIRHCDAALGDSILPVGMRLKYRTRESVLGLFAAREPTLPRVELALEMAKRVEQQAAQAAAGHHASRPTVSPK